MGWDKSTTNPLEWTAKMQDAPREAINIFAFEVFKRVVMRTPVDTGQARQNWLVSINEEDNSVLGADIKYKKVKKRKGEKAGKTVRKRTVKLERGASATMEQGRMAIAFAQGDDKILMQNNSPYIGVLEYGWFPKNPKRGGETKKGLPKTEGGYSSQAPQGMVGIVMAKADQLWKKAVQVVKGNL